MSYCRSHGLSNLPTNAKKPEEYCYGQSWLRPKGSRTTSSEGSTNSVANASKRHSVAFASSHNSAANSSNRRSVANASNRHSVAYDNIHSSSANASYLHPVAHDNSPISASCPGSGNSSRSSTPTKMLEPVAEKAPVKNPPPVPTRRIHSAQPYRSSTGGSKKSDSLRDSAFQFLPDRSFPQ